MINKFWLVSVNMGYGHQRTAYPLRNFACPLSPSAQTDGRRAFDNKIINANNYEGIPEIDEKIWEGARVFYEFISRFKRMPLIGNLAFSLYDKFQQIPAFYPHRDMSKPTWSLKNIFSAIKKGWGRHLIDELKAKNLKLKVNLPIVSTFFIPAFMAEFFDYPGEIFCVICDADIARSWVSLNPKTSRIKYFVPNSWVVERLKHYGVKEKNILLTGYPLPIENLGTENLETLKNDLKSRIFNLDPEKKYYQEYKPLIEKYLGVLPNNSDHVLTIMFSIGGAGAQKEIAIKFVKSLKKKIKNKEIKIILTAGIKENIKNYFLENIKNLGLKDEIGEDIEIIFAENIEDYFKEFNSRLRKTDILWTKPSELSFYSGLGLPIIIAPSIGSQEDFNRRWLLAVGAGILQENPKYADQWLFDYLNSGRFADAAMQGFIEVEKLGTYNILKHVLAEH